MCANSGLVATLVMPSKRFTLLVESDDLLESKHKCTVDASSLEELVDALVKSLQLSHRALIIEIYDKEFDEFVGNVGRISNKSF